MQIMVCILIKMEQGFQTRGALDDELINYRRMTDTNPSYGKGIDPEAIDSVAAVHHQAVQNRAAGNHVVE
jgi:hypothetical protein